MKTKSYLIAILLLATPFLSFALPPDYCFKNPVLVSGTDLQVGAVYRFDNVKPSTNALVKVTAFTGNVSLNAIDENWTGFDNAFQPFINVPALANGYVEFEITFINNGNGNPQTQSKVSVTNIDVDGDTYSNGKVYEQDQVELINGNYDFSATSPCINVTSVNQAGSNWVVGKNLTGLYLDGIDTLNKAHMFSVENNNVSKLKFRVGAHNTSSTTGDVRYRSVYFQKFTYPASILSINDLKDFSATMYNKNVNVQWSLIQNTTKKETVLEKSLDGINWTAIYTATVNNAAAVNGVLPVNYTDYNVNEAKTFYRVKLVEVNGNALYSKVIMIKTKEAQIALSTYPTSFKQSFMMQVQSDVECNQEVRIYSISGQQVTAKKVILNKGVNQIQVNDLQNLKAGAYIVSMNVQGVQQSVRVIKE